MLPPEHREAVPRPTGTLLLPEHTGEPGALHARRRRGDHTTRIRDLRAAATTVDPTPPRDLALSKVPGPRRSPLVAALVPALVAQLSPAFGCPAYPQQPMTFDMSREFQTGEQMRRIGGPGKPMFDEKIAQSTQMTYSDDDTKKAQWIKTVRNYLIDRS